MTRLSMRWLRCSASAGEGCRSSEQFKPPLRAGGHEHSLPQSNDLKFYFLQHSRADAADFESSLFTFQTSPFPVFTNACAISGSRSVRSCEGLLRANGQSLGRNNVQNTKHSLQIRRKKKCITTAETQSSSERSFTIYFGNAFDIPDENAPPRID